MNEIAWQKLMDSLGFKVNLDTFKWLVEKYSHHARKYHNQSHIESVLADLAQVKSLVSNYESVELALWFHDAIYNIFSSNNELDSANMAVMFLQNNTSDLDFSARVFNLINATKHNGVATLPDEKIIVDIDLSILATEWSSYQGFESDIRQEYKLIPWFIYRKKRIALLRSFLERESIYSHEYFRDRLESNARRNLENAIDHLQSGLK